MIALSMKIQIDQLGLEEVNISRILSYKGNIFLEETGIS